MALFKTDEYVMGMCVLEVALDPVGKVGELKLLRPTGSDERLLNALRRDVAAWQFRPARQCGKPVASTLTVSITHCPRPR
jgi:hypothetical protein